jgi:hypothetical protein
MRRYASFVWWTGYDLTLGPSVAGIIGGGVTIFFWKGTKYFVGAWGGFAFGLWIQCFRDGGLIRPIGFRYIMYIGQSRGLAAPCQR